MTPLAIVPLLRLCITRRRRAAASPSTLSLLPAYLAISLWPLALLILGVRLKTLNRLDPPPDVVYVLITAEEERREVMGLSVMGGLSILVFALSSHYDTFRYLNSLAKPSSARAGGLPLPGSPTTPKLKRVGTKRNQWPLSAGLGLAAVALIHLGWGLVGYLGVNGGGREANLFAAKALPLDDNWLIFVKLLVLTAVLAGVEPNLQAAYSRINKLLSVNLGDAANGMRLASSHNRTASYTPLHRSRDGSTPPTVGIGSEEDTNRSGQWEWRAALARVIVWSLIAGIGVIVCRAGEHGEGMASVAEIVGSVGSSLMCFLGPCTHLTLSGLETRTNAACSSVVLHRPLPPAPSPLYFYDRSCRRSCRCVIDEERARDAA